MTPLIYKMQTFVRGQRAALTQFLNATSFQVQIALKSARVPVFDFVCFGVDEREQLSDDRYMVFFNQKAAPGDAIILDELSDRAATFSVALAALPPEISRLVFTVSVDGTGTMSDLDEGIFSIREDASSSSNVVEYRFTGSDFDKEGALMLAALYRKDGTWRLWAQGQGFVGNLSALLKFFGGEEVEDSGQSAAPPTSGTPVVQPPVIQPPAARPPAVQPPPPISAPVAASVPIIAPPVTAPVGSLQQIITQAAPGSTVTLSHGEHQGPIYLDKPLVLNGGGAVIWAQNGPVVTVQSIGVTLSDLEIEVTAADETLPNSTVALWIAPGVGTQVQNVRARGDIIGVAAAEGEWKLPPFLNLGEFAPRADNRFQIEIETPHPSEIKSNILGVSLHPAQIPSGRQNVEIRVQNVAADTLIAGVIELSTGGVSRTIPISGRSAHEPRAAIDNLQLWVVDDTPPED